MQSQGEPGKDRAEPVSPTLSLSEAAARPWDAVVAGAGPAGSVLACVLARRGVAVLLVDKSSFPRDKVCGSCLNRAALAALEAAGLGCLPERLAAVPLDRMRIRAGGREAAIRLPRGMAISRRALDQALVHAAVAAGAAFLPQTEALLLPQASGTRTIELRCGGEAANVSTRLAVAADGLGGGFLKAIDSLTPVVAEQAPLGIGAVMEDLAGEYREGTIYMGCTPGGYLGVVRLEDGRVDVAAALDRGTAQKAGGITAAATALLEQSGLPRPTGFSAAFFRGTPFLTRRRRVAAEGLIVIGDAAGYVEPLTGEGMAWAMQEAILAAPLVCDAIAHGDPGLALRWQGQYDRFFRRRRSVCAWASWIRRHYYFGSLVVGLLARMPGLAAPWVRAVNRVSPEVLRSIVP